MFELAQKNCQMISVEHGHSLFPFFCVFCPVLGVVESFFGTDITTTTITTRQTRDFFGCPIEEALALPVCVCVWYAVGKGSVPVGSVVRLVHPIRAPLPHRRLIRLRGDSAVVRAGRGIDGSFSVDALGDIDGSKEGRSGGGGGSGGGSGSDEARGLNGGRRRLLRRG